MSKEQVTIFNQTLSLMNIFSNCIYIYIIYIYVYIYIYIYIDKLDDRVNKYNNMYPSTIKMKPVDIESITYIDFNKENNKKIS